MEPFSRTLSILVVSVIITLLPILLIRVGTPLVIVILLAATVVIISRISLVHLLSFRSITIIYIK